MKLAAAAGCPTCMRIANDPKRDLHGGNGEGAGKWMPIVVPLFALALAALVYFIAWGVL